MSKLHSAWSLGSDDELLLDESDMFAGDFGEPPFGRSSAPFSDDPFGAGAAPALPPAPRITIHAACDRLEITGLIASVSADRRLAHAEITVEHGGVEAAITRFADRPSPNLLIIDTLQRGAALLHSLDRLAQVIEQSTKVVVIGAVDDFALFRELMARGVSEYIVPPMQALDLIGAICRLYVEPAKPLAGRVMAVIGARGGVGASTIAHNVAWSIAERQGSRTTLLDLDLSFGTAALDFNEDPEQSIAEALIAPDRIDDVFLQCITTKPTQRLHMLTAPATLECDVELDGGSYELSLIHI